MRRFFGKNAGLRGLKYYAPTGECGNFTSMRPNNFLFMRFFISHIFGNCGVFQCSVKKIDEQKCHTRRC